MYDFDYDADALAEARQEANADAVEDAFRDWCDERGYEYDDEDARDYYFNG